MITQHTVNIILGATLVYYVLLQGSYMALILIGVFQQRRYHRDLHVGDLARIEQSPTTLPFTVIIPVYNEERIIVPTALSALALEYPNHEVIVVNDGSKDGTLAKLIDYFELVPTARLSHKQLPTQHVKRVYASMKHPKLLVIDKENGRRADAVNAGSNFSQYPLLCIMDADCVFESDALIRSVRPFQNSSHVIAATGIVRPANGLKMQDGKIVDFSLPRRWVALIQCVEYLRSFQWSRLGLARLGSLLSISGAFMVVKRSTFVDMGGCDPQSITDDIEFTMRLQRYVHEHKDENGFKPKIAYIPDPVCYAEVPERFKDYFDQRNRWQRGTLQATFKHLKMFLNPRYGAAGMFGMPFYLLFETLACLAEGLSYVIVISALALGHITWVQAGVFFFLAIGLGALVSVAAVLFEENTRNRTQNVRDLDRLLLACLIDNLGPHQLLLAIRIVATVEFLVLHKRYGTVKPRPGDFREPSPRGTLGSMG